MARKFGVSLNENDHEEASWIEGIDNSGMLPAHVIKEALRTYFGTSRQQEQVATNKDVIETLNNGFAMLGSKLDNIKHAHVQYQPTPDIARKQEPEVTEAQLDLEREFVVAVKKAARPGMRLETKQ